MVADQLGAADAWASIRARALARAQSDTHHTVHANYDECLHVVRSWLGLPGGEPTAAAAWSAEGGAGGPNTHTVRPAPPGVPVFFSPNHITLSAQTPGWVYSTDIHGAGTIGLVSIGHVETWLGGHKLGWSETLEHRRIFPHLS